MDPKQKGKKYWWSYAVNKHLQNKEADIFKSDLEVHL